MAFIQSGCNEEQIRDPWAFAYQAGKKARVADAYMTGRTNARAENADKKIKDVKRRSCGPARCETMCRRLLLASGRPPPGKGGVPLPNYNE